MVTFLKYAVGAIIFGAITAFLIRTIKSFIDDLRDRRAKKSLDGEEKKISSADSSDDVGKGGESK